MYFNKEKMLQLIESDEFLENMYNYMVDKGVNEDITLEAIFKAAVESGDYQDEYDEIRFN